MTSTAPVPLTSRRAFGWVLAVAAAAHGLLPLCTLVVSDDWFTLLAYQQASLAAVWEGAVYLSMPLTVLQALPFFLVGDDLLVLRVIGFAVVVALGQTIFLALAKVAPSRRSDALWVALFAVAVPGYQVHFMVSFLLYPLGLVLFASALWLAVQAEETEAPGRRRWLFVLAAALVFYSFHFGALLLFYGFFIVCHLHAFRRLRGGTWIEATVRYLATRYALLALPLLFWTMREVAGLLFPVWGSYNQPRLDAPEILRHLEGFLASYRAIAGEVLLSGWFAGPLALGLLWLAVGRGEPGRIEFRRRDLGLVFVGLLVLVVGILPFLLVGKSPLLRPEIEGLSAFGAVDQQILALIDTRMHLFLGLAAGLVAVGGLRVLAAVMGADRRAVTVLLVALLVSCAAANVSHYLHIEKQAVVMAGVREQLRARPELKEYGVLGVVDRIGNVSTTWDSWPLFLQTVWGDRAHHAVPELWFGKETNTRLLYDPETMVNHRLYGGAWQSFISRPDSPTRQATVVLTPGERFYAESDAGTMVLHQFYRFVRPERLAGFVRKFASVTVLPKVVSAIELADPRFGADWQELSPSSPTGGPPPGGGRAQVGIGDDHYALVPAEGTRQILLVVEPPAAVADSVRMVLTDGAGGRIPALRSVRPDGSVALLGLAGPAVRSVRLAREHMPGIPTPWRVRSVRQQPAGGRVFAWWLPQPFLPPEVVYAESLRGRWQVETALYGPLFRDQLGAGPARLVRERDHAVFEAGEGKEVLWSRLIPIDGGAQRYLRVEWPVGAEPAARVLITDPDGRPLLELASPAGGGRRDYLVPATPGWGHLRVGFQGRPGGRVLLPHSVEMVQAAALTALDRPVAALFHPQPPP